MVMTHPRETPEISLVGTGLSKIFNRRTIFRDISFQLKAGNTLLITGRNGAGKSTLLKVMAGILTPTSGRLSVGGRTGLTSPYRAIGFVSPYLNLYDEFSPRENLFFSISARSMEVSSGAIDNVLDRVGLDRFKDIPSRVFSSGMKQRLKYAFALIHEPPILLLDEPTSNLDREGKEFVRGVMDQQVSGGILVVATNEQTDVTRYDYSVRLGQTGSIE